MQTSLISKMTWQDVREIATAANNANVNEFTNEEEYYSNVLLGLNRQYKTLTACRERYKEILPIAEGIVGMKNRKERLFDLIVLRGMVACKLHDEGYSISDIGRVMGYNHSTIIHYFDKRRDFFTLPLMYEREVRWFKQFDTALEDGRGTEDY